MVLVPLEAQYHLRLAENWEFFWFPPVTFRSRRQGWGEAHGEGGRGNSACPESALARTEEISQSFSVKIIPARRSGGPDGEAAASSV